MMSSRADAAPASGRRADLPTVPTATRAHRPGWRDPRIWAGLSIVAVCVLLGARLVAAADNTVAVWAAVRPLPVGTTLEEADVELRRVHFADRATAERYLHADVLPEAATLRHPVAAGELVAVSALSDGAAEALVQVPLGVEQADLPATVQRGSVVDVWVTPQTAGRVTTPATRVLHDVVVVALPKLADGFGAQAARQVIVGVPVREADDDLARAIGAVSSGHVVLTVAGS